MRFITKAGLAVGTALLLAACSSGGGGGTASSEPAGTLTALPAPARTATPTPTPSPYGPVLTRYVGPVNTALAKVTVVNNLADFDTVLGEIGTSATSAGTGLRRADQPAEVTAAQTELVTALGQVSTDMTKVRSDIKRKNVCALSSALSEFGQTQGLKAASAALSKLTAAGYPTTFAVPQIPPLQTRSLENGTMVREGRLHGHGVFKVDNGGSSDAVVSLAMDGKSVHSVFVAKGQKASIEGVEDGTYDVFFSGGVDWDGGAKAFTQSCRFSKFQDTLAFETGRTYTSWSITLQPTVGGNAKTDDVDAKNFPQP
ncbi:hypothetical protein [Kitasatospora aureofaciens]|uniref:hypothetical protein n=1 Tax=Kitasatospora aureofaciens TaxID=1894 RepID=UPI003814E26A